MANQRSKDKIKVQTYLHKDDEKLLRETAKSHGYKNLAEFFQAVARGAVKVSPQIKALVMSAMGAGAEQSGCGMMMFLILGIPTALWLFCQCSA